MFQILIIDGASGRSRDYYSHRHILGLNSILKRTNL